MVTPKYLNLFTYLRLVPWLSLMFVSVPLLLLTIISVFPVLTVSPLLSVPFCQPSHLLCISSSVSVTTARSSANSSSHGSPHLNSSLMTSSTTINRNGLIPDSWCRPTLMVNYGILLLLASLASLGPFSDTNTPDPWATCHTPFSKSTKVKTKSLCTSMCVFLQLLYDKYCICCTFPWTKSKLPVGDCDQFSKSAL